MSERQEREPAQREVSEVAPDVLRMQLPISMPGLGHVNCYALLDDQGAAVVDPGLPGPATWKAIKDRLSQAQLKVSDVHTVVVTHSHPDHFGGAMRFAKEAGARIVAHESFRFGVTEALREEPEVSVEDLGHGHSHGPALAEAAEDGGADGANDPVARPVQTPVPAHMKPFGRGATPWGGEHPRPPMRTRLKWMAMRWLSSGSIVPTITHPVRRGDTLKLARREWFVVHTPGHTEDHICLHSPELGLFLAGDHVLPTITPHISGLSLSQDPLKAFYDSLDLVAAIGNVEQALPAHGHPFGDLASRCEAIKRHHDERLEKVRDISRAFAGAATVEAFSQKLFKRRSWGAMAESETYAHLEHLRIAGDAERSADREGKFLYLT
jgi:glyoxylase-like metal-dependent hydrolase (beta-lactamase superfamily II)